HRVAGRDRLSVRGRNVRRISPTDVEGFRTQRATRLFGRTIGSGSSAGSGSGLLCTQADIERSVAGLAWIDAVGFQPLKRVAPLRFECRVDIGDGATAFLLPTLRRIVVQELLNEIVFERL